MDVDARYVDVAVRRWQAFTGRAAVLAGEDRVFDDVADARAKPRGFPADAAHVERR
jgi:hypothetical protein